MVAVLSKAGALLSVNEASLKTGISSSESACGSRALENNDLAGKLGEYCHRLVDACERIALVCLHGRIATFDLDFSR
jgi:hypothetical protein